MSHRSSVRAAVVTLLSSVLVGTSPTALPGQVAAAGARLQTYTFSDSRAVGLESVELRSFPWSVALPLSSWAGVSMTGAFARASITMVGGEQMVLDGPTDTRASVRAAWRGLAVEAQAVLPTGDGARTAEGVTVVGLLNNELLAFRPPPWGTGLGLGADVAYATRVGRTTLIAGAGYAAVGGHAPLAGLDAEYVPADQTHFRLETATRVGATGALSVLVGVRRFDDDTLDGTGLYTAGNRLEGVVSYAFPIGANEGAQLYGGVYHRGAREDASPLGGRPTAAEVLLPGSRPAASRTLLVVGGGLSALRTRWSLAPRTELRILRSADGLGQGWVATLQLVGERRLVGYRLGRRLALRPGAALRFGRVLAEEGAESNVRGFEVTLGVAWLPGV